MANTQSCDKIHLLELCLHQRLKDLASSPMEMAVSLAYRKYGVDGEDNITYASTSKSISIDDYLLEALTAPSQSDTVAMLAAVQAIEAATATIITLLGDDGVAEVIA